MTKDTIKNIALGLAIVLLVVICVNVYDLKKQVDSFESERSMLYSMNTNVMNIQTNVDNKCREIKGLLEDSESLFSETSVNIKLQDKKLAVVMHAVPKEINNNETLIAKITAGDKVYEQEADQNGNAVILVDMIDVIKPMFIIKSETGVKQETLPDEYTDEALSVEIHTQWGEPEVESWDLSLWIVKTDKELPFEKSDIAKAEFLLIEIDEEYEEKYEEYLTNNVLSGDFDFVSIPAEEIAGSEGKLMIGYTADFSKYADKNEGSHYEIHFVLTTKDGTKYMSPYNPVASFTSHDDGCSKGSGSDSIRPIFE